MSLDRHKLCEPTVSQGITSLATFWWAYPTPKPFCLSSTFPTCFYNKHVRPQRVTENEKTHLTGDKGKQTTSSHHRSPGTNVLSCVARITKVPFGVCGQCVSVGDAQSVAALVFYPAAQGPGKFGQMWFIWTL